MAINQRKAGAILSYSIIILNTFVGLLYTPYKLLKMGQNEYGLYSLVFSVIGYLTILDFGFGNAVIRYTAKYRAEGKENKQASMYGMFIILYSLIGVIALAAGFILYLNIDNIFGNSMAAWELDKARTLMIIMVLNIAFTFPLSVFGGIITAYEDFIFIRIIQLIRIVLSTVVMVIILFYGYKAIGMALVMTFFNFATLIINYIYSKHRLKIKIKFKHIEFKFLREVLLYSFWIFLNIIMDKVYWSTGQFVLGAISGTVTVAIFAVAIQLETMYVSFSTAITGVFLPRVTAMISTGSGEKEISDLFIKIGRVQNYIVLFILMGFMIFGQQFIYYWAGKDYSDVYYIALMFFVALLVELIQNIGNLILQAKNQLKFRSILYFCLAIFCLGLQIPLAKAYGGIGCAIAISGTLLLGQGLIMNIYYQKVQHLDIIRFWKQIIKISAPLIIISFFIKWIINVYTPSYGIIKLIVFIILFSIVYWVVAITVSMNRYEKNLIMNPILKLYNKLR